MVHRGEGEWGASIYRIEVEKDDKVLEMDVGDGCTTMLMYLMSQNCTLQNDQSSKFYVYFSTTSRRKEGKRRGEGRKERRKICKFVTMQLWGHLKNQLKKFALSQQRYHQGRWSRQFI